MAHFRAGLFPRSGPQNWIDAPNALIEMERRKATGELSEADAIHSGGLYAPPSVDLV